MELTALKRPLAITMWDFSWLERRWPGAGYEDWGLVLDELKLRGYDAVRIDAYPHLVASGPEREWELLPCWNQQDWGSPSVNRVQVQPALNRFIEACASRDLKVGLSTWFREDASKRCLDINSPEALGRIWKSTLDTIADAGLLEAVLYVDLCNEWPLEAWTPFLPADVPRIRSSEELQRWTQVATGVVRNAYPSLPYTFSLTHTPRDDWRKEDVSSFDLLEPHVWMVNFSDFYERVGYRYERFDPTGYGNLVQNGERLYRENPEKWLTALQRGIHSASEWSRVSGKPLITTECWGPVDYKDWPLLDWGWVKELCEYGTVHAVETGSWVALATSNFCGPQFEGMWRDVDWHQRLTDRIHSTHLQKAATS